MKRYTEDTWTAEVELSVDLCRWGGIQDFSLVSRSALPQASAFHGREKSALEARRWPKAGGA
jgi:hypothetical protein